MSRISLFCSIAMIALVSACARHQSEPARVEGSFLRDYAETRGFGLGRPVRPKPAPDGSAVLFLRAEPRKATLSLYSFDTATGQTQRVLTPEQILRNAEERLSPEEKARRERQRVSVGGITDFQLSPDGSRLLVTLSGKLYLVERGTGTARELPIGNVSIIDPKFSPDGKRVAFVANHDVHVLDLAADTVRAVTTGGTAQVSHGLAEFVAQEEMDRFTGYWWSPDSRSILYEIADAREVETWYVADPANPGRPPYPSAYPRPGKANVKVSLAIAPVSGGAATAVRWDVERYPYLAFVQWSDDGYLSLGVQTRDQKELALLKAEPASGATTPLLSERDATWVNIPPDVPRWLGRDRGFLWISEADGGPQLELREPSGQRSRILVPHAAGFSSLMHVDRERNTIVYAASTDPTQSQLYSLSLAGPAEPKRLTTEPGRYGAAYSKNGAVYVLSQTSIHSLPRTTVHRTDGTMIGELPSIAETPPFVPQVELLTVGKDRTFYASIVRPRGFDATMRYPVIVDVYGGPHHLQVSNSRQRYLLSQWMADQGFIVVAIDNRGTPGRGRDWERAIYQRLGDVPLEDQVAGLKALGERYPQLDLGRVGITGWSFGGYLSALAAIRRPDVYHAAVAGAPVVDWEDYDTHYTERYLGIPPADAAAYARASLLTYAGELRRPLLLVHGTADDNVYFRHTLRLTEALFRAGKDFEVLPLSGLTHMVPDPVVTERLHTRIIGHFKKHLGEPARAAKRRNTKRS